uniref:MCM AAA-lid domain-containing protein n=1 Tax=Gopherus evgoodei TaxID=1825980 RepID=A0A8C4Y3N3_9SAUR
MPVMAREIAYVNMREIGGGGGMVSAYPCQLESLIRLAEAHAKVRFSNKAETIDVEEAKRLHQEVLKQSATDPRTGIVDISILKVCVNKDKLEELAQALKKLIQSKGKTPALKYQQLFDDLRAQSDAAVTKGMLEEALRALADDDFLTVTGKTVRIAVMKC